MKLKRSAAIITLGLILLGVGCIFQPEPVPEPVVEEANPALPPPCNASAEWVSNPQGAQEKSL